jgi:hypothetical protein
LNYADDAAQIQNNPQDLVKATEDIRTRDASFALNTSVTVNAELFAEQH